METGYLKVYIGCMFSGKTTALLNEIARYKVITEEILVVNHFLDGERNDRKSVIMSHNKKEHVSTMVEKLEEIINLEEYKKARVVIIDEGQFYKDLYKVVSEELRKENKTFIVGGLSSDFNMKAIGEMTQLIPIADEVIKLEAYCVYCKNGNKASFTKRIVEDKTTILVGKSDMYVPVCRKHHIERKVETPH